MQHSVEFNTNIQAQAIYKNFIFILALLVVPLSGLAIDIYVPSLPAISHYFLINKSLAQLTITFYMIGLAISQLFAGVISDSFGRRKPFLFAMLGFIAATFLIPFSQNIQELLILRLIQGSAVALVIVPMRSVLNDLFQGPEYFKKSNYMFLAWSMGPIVAPAIGGYTQHYFGWQGCFYLLLGYSLITFLLVALFMPETSTYQHPFQLRDSLKRYQSMLIHKEYLSGLLVNCSLYSLIILFAVVGPFLIENILHYSAIQFGRFALLSGLAWFLGGFTNRFLAHIPLAIKSKVVFFTMFILAIIALGIDYYVPFNAYLIVIPTIVLLYLGGIIFPNNFALSTALFPKNSGSANALFGSVVFLMAGISSALGTLLKASNQLPLAFAYIVIILICLAISMTRKNQYLRN